MRPQWEMLQKSYYCAKLKLIYNKSLFEINIKIIFLIKIKYYLIKLLLTRRFIDHRIVKQPNYKTKLYISYRIYSLLMAKTLFTRLTIVW